MKLFVVFQAILYRVLTRLEKCLLIVQNIFVNPCVNFFFRYMMLDVNLKRYLSDVNLSVEQYGFWSGSSLMISVLFKITNFKCTH